jgi:hypothetical protein
LQIAMSSAQKWPVSAAWGVQMGLVKAFISIRVKDPRYNLQNTWNSRRRKTKISYVTKILMHLKNLEIVQYISSWVLTNALCFSEHTVSILIVSQNTIEKSKNVLIRILQFLSPC